MVELIIIIFTMSFKYTSIIKTNKKKKNFCINCGKYGHTYRKCNDPITSFGVVLFKLDIDNINKILTTNKISTKDFIDNFTIQKNAMDNYYVNKKPQARPINILKTNNNNYNNFKFIKLFKDKIKFLLIRRRNTLGYIEFIRGRYTQNETDYLISLFEQMTPEEIDKINDKSFDELWDELWKCTSDNKLYEHEYELSKDKYTALKNGVFPDNLKFYTKNIKPIYESPEWGFPKGRRTRYEKNLECARREFEEETDFDEDDYIILDKLFHLEETFTGTNSIIYKHIYFAGISINDKIPSININNHSQIIEIGDIGWFTYKEVCDLIRPSHTHRIKLLTESYLFIIENIISLSNNPCKFITTHTRIDPDIRDAISQINYDNSNNQ